MSGMHRKTPEMFPFQVFSKAICHFHGGDKRDRTADLLNAMAHVMQNTMDNPHIPLKNKKYWKYCTQLLD